MAAGEGVDTDEGAGHRRLGLHRQPCRRGALSDAGNEVTILDRHRSPYLREDQRFITGDILDREQMQQAVAGHDAVYHLAGIAHLDIGLTAPIETVEQNVLGTVIALEAARLAAVKRFVYASSVYVYSEGGSFYRCSKQAAELYVEEYQRRHGLDFTILRFGTVYGPRADRHNSVRRYLKQALREHRIVAAGTGDEIREYVHVKDAAQSSVQVLGDAFRNERVVLTGHHPMRFADLLEMIREILGDVTVELRPPEPRIRATPTRATSSSPRTASGRRPPRSSWPTPT